MSEIVIEKFKDQVFLPQVEEIFFESSSKKTFRDEKERDEFRWKYLGYYLRYHSEMIWIARRQNLVLGYILGSLTTNGPELIKIQPHLTVFLEHFSEYPAHLHINCHKDSRGQGIGQKLVNTFELELRNKGIVGVHLMTSPDSRNRHFYQRLGYSVEIINTYLGGPILLMGKSLQGNKF